MRGALPAVAAVMLAVPLSGCVVAAVPVLAGAAIARSETARKQPRQESAPTATPSVPAATAATSGSANAASPPLPAPRTADAAASLPPPSTAMTPGGIDPTFAALVDHVRSRATLWSEGAPINSLVLDERQTVLNPVAVGCARRPPVVIVDLDEASGAAPPGSATMAGRHWPKALSAIRAMDVGIIWVTGQPAGQIKAMETALALVGLSDPASDRVLAPAAGQRKQQLRQTIAREACVLAVVGDKRGDADEAYDFLRNANAALPIDGNWGAGWFLLPPPLVALTNEKEKGR